MKSKSVLALILVLFTTSAFAAGRQKAPVKKKTQDAVIREKTPGGASVTTPKQCYDSINSSMASLMGIVTGVGDGALSSYVKTGAPRGFAMNPASEKALKSKGMMLMGFASACSAQCRNNANVGLEKICREATGIVSLDGKKLAPFIESNNGLNGFKARVKEAYNQKTSEGPEVSPELNGNDEGTTAT